MALTATVDYSVEAHNISHASENKIHDDTVARKLGFAGVWFPVSRSSPMPPTCRWRVGAEHFSSVGGSPAGLPSRSTMAARQPSSATSRAIVSNCVSKATASSVRAVPRRCQAHRLRAGGGCLSGRPATRRAPARRRNQPGARPLALQQRSSA